MRRLFSFLRAGVFDFCDFDSPFLGEQNIRPRSGGYFGQIVGYCEQSGLYSDLFNAAKHESFEVLVVLDLGEDGFHVCRPTFSVRYAFLTGKSFLRFLL